MSTATAPRAGTYLSASRLNLWLQCPRRFRYQYVEKLPWATAPSALVFGSAVHAALADLYQARLEGNEPTLDDLHANFRVAWSAEVKPIELKDGESVEGLDALARAMLAVVLEQPQHGRILAVEEAFEVLLDESLPPLKGVIDEVEVRDGRVVVREHKTAARAWSADQVENSLQATVYAVAACEMHLPGVSGIGDVDVEFQIVSKSKRPSVDLRLTKRNAQHVDELRDVATAVVTAEREGVFPRRRDWHCSSCPYEKQCASGR